SETDPVNRLLAYQNVKRLDFESMRDSLLAVSGMLDPRMGGPASQEAIDFKFRRRGLYGRIDRLNLPEQLRTFDFPDPNTAAVERSITTTPSQSLFLLNHPLLRAAAEALVARVDTGPTSNSNPENSAISAMAWLAWQRELSADELRELSNYLGLNSSSTDKVSAQEKLVSLAQAMLIANEFQFID
ncbi:MAG: DUF1553 domain-containing protein, partial [bacterium]